MGREIDEELQFHVDAMVSELMASGLSAEDARRAALGRFGRLDLLGDEGRHVKGVGLVDGLRQDIRYGLRLFRRQPGFTTAAVLTLALGIGANSAVFTIVDAVLLKPLPYPDSDRIVLVALRNPSEGMDWSSLGNADFDALVRSQRSFDHIAAFTPGGRLTFIGSQEPTQVAGTRVTAGFFSVLGVKPVLGRAFRPGEDAVGRPPTVVVSHRFWREYLGGDEAAIGRSVTLDERDHVVVGVMPAAFRFGRNDADLVWPILQLPAANSRPPYYLRVLARLREGVTPHAATTDVTRIAADVERQYPGSGYHDAAATPWKERLVGNSRLALLVLFGAVALVLAIAVVNVANLQLARSAVRGREMAVRCALGAGRLRLARQLLTESLLLVALAAALGLLVAYVIVRMAVLLAPNVVPRLGESTVDGRALVFTAGVAIVSAGFFGMAPVLRIRSAAPAGSLNAGGKTGESGPAWRPIHGLLVVAELSLAVVLLIGAGLLIRSFARLQAVDPGFDPDNVVTMEVSLPEARYETATEVTAFYRQLLERMQATPGVEEAAISLGLPPNLLQVLNPFHLEGQPYGDGQTRPLAEEIPISEDYFHALGIPLVAGRIFNESDRLPGRSVLIINASMARRYFPGKDPVGRRIQTGDARPDTPWSTIVGVVGDVKYQGLDATGHPTMYVPFYDEGWNPWFVRSMSIVVRTPREPAGVLAAVRGHVTALDANVPVPGVRTMKELLSGSVATPRFRTVLLGAFAALALVLAAIGVYGVLAYSVARRTHEIGIRLALGARQRDVLRHVIGEGGRLVAVGVAAGIAASFALTRVTESLLFGVSATDPLTFTCVALLLALVALAACYIPARRAAAVDPLVALRYE